ncbi:armadillo-type protein [Gorgonomyces haynaldii]|nr:armadillo-type protein [Gorgonomyces haynaldii]
MDERVFPMTSTQPIAELLLSEDQETRLHAMASMKLSIQDASSVLELWDYEMLCQLMLNLRKVIMNVNQEDAVSAVTVLETVSEKHAQTHYPSDYERECVEASFHHALPYLIQTLGRADAYFINHVSRFFQSYARACGSKSLCALLSRYGLDHVDWMIRKQSLQLLQEAIQSQVLTETDDVLDLALQALSDTSKAVQDQAKDLLLSLKQEHPGFVKALRQKSETQRHMVEQILSEVEQHDGEEEKLELGILPFKYFMQLQYGDWRVREHVVEIFLQLTQKAVVQDIMPTIDSLLRLLQELVNDSNFKLKMTSLRALSQVLQKTGKLLSDSQQAFALQILMPLLAEGRQVIRNIVIQNLILLIRSGDTMNTIDQLMGLVKSPNSRLRMEIFNVLTITTLMFPSRVIINQNIAQALDFGLLNSKSAVRYCALEACAVLAKFCGKDHLLQHLQPLLKQDMMDLLHSRFQDGRMPFLNMDGTLEHIYATQSLTAASVYSTNEGIITREKTITSLLEQPTEHNDIDEAFKTISTASEKLLEGIKSIQHAIVKSQAQLEDALPIAKQSIKPKATIAEKPKMGAAQVEKEFKDLRSHFQGTEDWSEIQKNLQKLLHLVTNFSESLVPFLSDYCIILADQVQNLRSSVAKLAIRCISSVFKHLPKQVEGFLDHLVLSLLRKIGEGNAFMITEIEQCLDTMADHVTHTRTLNALLANASHKNAAVRQKVACYIDKIVTPLSSAQMERLLRSVKEAEKILNALAMFLREGSAETRNFAKHTLFVLSTVSEFKERLPKSMNITRVNEIKEMLANYVTKVDVDRTTPPPSNRVSLARNESKKSVTHSVSETSLEDITIKLSSDDWQQRYEGIDQVCHYLISNERTLTKYNVRAIFDSYSQRLTDGNSKVAIKALTSLPPVITALKTKLDPALPLILTTLSSQLLSSNAQVRDQADAAMNAVLESNDNTMLTQVLSNLTVYGNNGKLRSAVLDKLCNMMQSGTVKSSAIKKYVVPSALKLVTQDKADTKKHHKRLIGLIYNAIGDQLFDLLGKLGHPPDIRQKIEQALK